MSKIKIIVIATLIFFIFLGGIFLLMKKLYPEQSLLEYYEENYLFVFPKDTKVSYSYTTVGGWHHNEGVTYSVLEFETPPDTFIKIVETADEMRVDGEYVYVGKYKEYTSIKEIYMVDEESKEVQKKAEMMIGDLPIQDEHIIDWDSNYAWWTDGDLSGRLIILIFLQDSNQLILCEWRNY